MKNLYHIRVIDYIYTIEFFMCFKNVNNLSLFY